MNTAQLDILAKIEPLADGISAPQRVASRDETPPSSAPGKAPIGENSPSGYENAPATKLVATHCAACGRPLLDALSVETGMGPVCRKWLHTKCESEEHRAEVNKLVYQIAAVGPSLTSLNHVARIRKLGFNRLADKLESRLAEVVVKLVDLGTKIAVKTPYRADAVRDWQSIPGRRWDKDNKVNVIPFEQRTPLFMLLRRHYAGALAVGITGPFMIGDSSTGV